MIPSTLNGWKIERLTLDFSRVVVARRSGVTFVFTSLEESRQWRVTKIRGGRVLAEKIVSNLPPNVRKVVFHVPNRRRSAEAQPR